MTSVILALTPSSSWYIADGIVSTFFFISMVERGREPYSRVSPSMHCPTLPSPSSSSSSSPNTLQRKSISQQSVVYLVYLEEESYKKADIPMASTITILSASALRAASFAATSSSNGLNLMQYGTTELLKTPVRVRHQPPTTIFGFDLLTGRLHVCSCFH